MNFIERLDKVIGELVEKHMRKYQPKEDTFWKEVLGVEDTKPCSPSFEQLEALEFEQMETNVYNSWGKLCE